MTKFDNYNYYCPSLLCPYIHISKCPYICPYVHSMDMDTDMDIWTHRLWTWIYGYMDNWTFKLMHIRTYCSDAGYEYIVLKILTGMFKIKKNMGNLQVLFLMSYSYQFII
jgi:hypothetical protein